MHVFTKYNIRCVCVCVCVKHWFAQMIVGFPLQEFLRRVQSIITAVLRCNWRGSSDGSATEKLVLGNARLYIALFLTDALYYGSSAVSYVCLRNTPLMLCFYSTGSALHGPLLMLCSQWGTLLCADAQPRVSSAKAAEGWVGGDLLICFSVSCKNG